MGTSQLGITLCVVISPVTSGSAKAYGVDTAMYLVPVLLLQKCPPTMCLNVVQKMLNFSYSYFLAQLKYLITFVNGFCIVICTCVHRV